MIKTGSYRFLYKYLYSHMVHLTIIVIDEGIPNLIVEGGFFIIIANVDCWQKNKIGRKPET